MNFSSNPSRHGYSRHTLKPINHDDVTIWIKNPPRQQSQVLPPIIFFPGLCEGFEANIDFLSRFKDQKIIYFYVLPNAKRNIVFNTFLDESDVISPGSTFHLVTHSQGIYCLLDYGIEISKIAERCESLVLMNPAGIIHPPGWDSFRRFILESTRYIGELLFTRKLKLLCPAFYESYRYVENSPSNAIGLIHSSFVSSVTTAIKTLKDDYDVPVGAVISTDDWIFDYQSLQKALIAIGIDKKFIIDIDTNHMPQVMYPKKTAALVTQLWASLTQGNTP